MATIVINKQLQLLNNAQLGYNKDHLLVLESSKYPNGSTAFKNELLKYSKIEAVSVANFRIGETVSTAMASKDSSGSSQPMKYVNLIVDSDFLKTMQLTLVEGNFAARNIDKESLKTMESASVQKPQAYKNFVLSREVVKNCQMENPIGKLFSNGYDKGVVAGVVEDFNVTSFKDNISAVILQVEPDLDLGHTYLRVASGNMAETIQYIQKTYKTMFPYQKGELSFVNERLQQLYTSEQRLAALFNVFVSITIVIVCTGLFSLVALVVQQRTKEIGIRKVLGANTLNIIKLVTVDFVYLVLFGFLIASPIAWWAMSWWLTDYAKRIDIQWWVFATAGISVLSVALVTVGLQTLRAAAANPVDSLRNE